MLADRSVLVRLRADISDFQRKFATAGSEANAFVKRLEGADSRLANIVQSALALAPALVPVGSIAVPALAGLTQQLGLAAAAAGVAYLSFQGVGDALKALNDYQIDPTAAHFKKLQQTMDAIGPAGQVFVHTLQDLRPEMQKLQDAGQQGMFPGLTQGIRDLMALEPDVEHIISTIASTMGDLGQQAGAHLNDQRWVDFIHFLDTEARPTLTAMAKTLGLTVEGLASMMVAFDPMADGFTNGMVNYARRFRDWADQLDQTQGFQDFVDYIHDNGPEAMATLGAIAKALISLVSAAAPVGSAVLPIIQALANGLSAIADSNVGPALITAAAAIGTLGRTLAILRAVGIRGDGDSVIGRALNVSSIKSAPAAIREAAAAAKELQVAEQEAAVAHSRYIGALKANSVASVLIPGRKASAHMVQVTDELVAANQRQAAAAKKAAAAEEARAATVRKAVGGIGRASVVVGGLAFATSDLSQNVGLANTATYAMLGTLGGPWGTAVGGAIGLVQDLTSAGDDLTKSLDNIDESLGRGFQGMSQADSQLEALHKRLADLQRSASHPTFGDALGNAFDPAYYKEIGQHLGDLSALYSDEVDAMNAKSAELYHVKKAVYDVGLVLGQTGKAMADWTDSDYAATITRITPAMDALGISVDDLKAAAASGSEDVFVLGHRIASYLEWSDSAEGRTKMLADSMNQFGDQMVSTADAATALKASLDALLGPGLDLSQATDAWSAGLQHLQANLAKSGRSLDGQTDSARDNRQAIRDLVGNLSDLLTAQGKAGATPDQLAKTLRRGRQAILDAGAAAGLSRKELRRYLNELGLTPAMVKTIVNLDTDAAKQKHQALLALLGRLDQYKATPHIGADTSAADAGIAHVRGELAGLDNKTIYITTIRRGTSVVEPHAQVPSHKAGGGPIWGPGTKTSDSVPVMASHGEFMMSAAAVDHYGMAWMYAANARRLADGGSVDKPKLTEAERKALSRANAVRRADQSFNLGGGMTVKEVRSELHTFAVEIHRAGYHLGKAFDDLGGRAVELVKKWDQNAKALDAARSQVADIRSQVGQTFMHDAFGGSLKDFDTQVAADRNDAQKMKAALAKAKRHGLTGPLSTALAESGNLTLAQEFAGLTRAQIRQREHQFEGRTADNRQLGNLAVAMSGLPKEIRHLAAANEKVVARLNHIEDRIEHAVYRGAHDGTADRERQRNRDTAARTRVGR